MSDTQKWVAGWNLPGCLPEMEPAVFDSYEDAQQFIANEIEFMSGSGVKGDPYVYWVEPLLEDV